MPPRCRVNIKSACSLPFVFTPTITEICPLWEFVCFERWVGSVGNFLPYFLFFPRGVTLQSCIIVSRHTRSRIFDNHLSMLAQTLFVLFFISGWLPSWFAQLLSDPTTITCLQKSLTPFKDLVENTENRSYETLFYPEEPLYVVNINKHG